jgi:TPR repeat protein
MAVGAVSAPARDPADRVLIGIVAVGLLGIAVLKGVTYVKTAPQRAAMATAMARPMGPDISLNDARVSSSMFELARCLEQHKRTHEPTGFPRTLTELVGSGCMPADAVDESKATHHYRYFPGVPDEKGRTSAFTLCAQPLRYGQTGRTTLVMEEAAEGVEPYQRGSSSMPQTAGATEPLNCTEPWLVSGFSRGMLTAIKHCAFEYATTREEQGYPARASDIQDCLATSRARPRAAGDVILVGSEEKHARYAYLPGPAGSDGRIRTFTAYEVGYLLLSMGPSGVVHESDRREAARRRARDFRARVKLRLSTGEVVANLPRLERECQDAPATCADLGDALIAQMDEYDKTGKGWAGADLAFRRACTARAGLGCFRAGDLIEHARFLTSRNIWERSFGSDGEACSLFEKACLLGYGEGCWRAAARDKDQLCAGLGKLPLMDLLERGCDLAPHDSCAELGRQYLAGSRAPGGAGRVASLLTAACERSDPRACGPLAQIRLAQAKPEDVPAVQALFRKACALAEDPPSCQWLEGAGAAP